MKTDRDEAARPTYEVTRFDPGIYQTGPAREALRFELNDDLHMQDYFGIVLRRKWIVLVFLSAVVALTLFFSLMMNPTYRSVVVIKIDKDPSAALSAQGFDLNGTGSDYYQTQHELLKSRVLAELVIRRLSLDSNPDFLPAASRWSAIGQRVFGTVSASVLPQADPRSVLLPQTSGEQGTPAVTGVPLYLSDALLKRLQVLPVKNSQLVRISFDANAPEVSAGVANEIAAAFIQYSTDSRINASRQARDFLQKQAELTRAKVEDAEQRLNQYAAGNGIIFIDNDKVSVNNQKLSELTSSLSAVSSERIQKESVYRQVTETGTENPLIMNNPLIQGLAKEHASLEAEYFNLMRTYTPDYPKMKNIRNQLDSLRNSIEKEKASITRSLESDYLAALRKEKHLTAAFETQKSKVLDFQKKTVEYQALKREAEVNRELHNALQQKLNQVGITAMSTATNIQIIDSALVPRKPATPNIPINILFSLVAGLAGGVGLTFLADYFDNSIKNTRDLERSVRMPALGMIPDIHQYRALREAKTAVIPVNSACQQRPLLSGPGSSGAVAEAFRLLGTFIMLSSAEKPPKTILITSCEEKVGKTTVSINISTALTESLGKGIIIDADLRRPRLHKAFGLDNTRGLSTLLSGNSGFSELSTGLIRQTAVNRLDILTSGPVPPNPSELLISARMQELLTLLYADYDFIIIDSAPVMGLADPLYLGSIVDGTVLVVKSGETPRRALLEVKEIFRNINAKVLGVVLNGVKEKELKYGHYNYYSSYYRS